MGCGLTVDTDGLLVVNTVGAWPFACDQEDLGSGVYCSPADGALRVAPPVLARTVATTGGFTPGSPIAIGDGNRDTIDTIDFTLTNPSSCYSARVLITLEAEVRFIVDEGESVVFYIGGDTYYKIKNNGTGSQDTISWQMSRTLVYTLTPGQVLPQNILIEGQAIGGVIHYNFVAWKSDGLIVAAQ